MGLRVWLPFTTLSFALGACGLTIAGSSDPPAPPALEDSSVKPSLPPPSLPEDASPDGPKGDGSAEGGALDGG